MRAANRRLDGRANDPRRIMHGRLVRVEPGEIDCVAVAGKWRSHDRSRRHHGWPGRAGIRRRSYFPSELRIRYQAPPSRRPWPMLKTLWLGATCVSGGMKASSPIKENVLSMVSRTPSCRYTRQSCSRPPFPTPCRENREDRDRWPRCRHGDRPAQFAPPCPRRRRAAPVRARRGLAIAVRPRNPLSERPGSRLE